MDYHQQMQQQQMLEAEERRLRLQHQQMWEAEEIRLRLQQQMDEQTMRNFHTEMRKDESVKDWGNRVKRYAAMEQNKRMLLQKQIQRRHTIDTHDKSQYIDDNQLGEMSKHANVGVGEWGQKDGNWKVKT